MGVQKCFRPKLMGKLDKTLAAMSIRIPGEIKASLLHGSNGAMVYSTEEFRYG